MATIPVPLTTDVSPWVWYDSADPTMVRNTGTTLTAWYNKGTSGGLTNGTLTGTITYGASSQNNTPVVGLDGTASFSFPSTSATTSGPFAIFTVSKSTTNSVAPICDGAYHVSVGFNNATQLYVGISGQAQTYSLLTIPDARTEMKLYSIVASGTGSNSSVSINGSIVPINTGNLTNLAGTPIYTYPNTSAGSTAAATRRMGSIVVGETIVYMGEITSTQRQQIEGYLAWKWGLQANLPASHPYSVANKTATMALYGRPHAFVSTFADLTSQMGSLLLRGLAIDPNTNNIYTSINESSVLKITPAGIVSTFTTVGEIQRTGVACDLSGNIYVSYRSSPNSRIRKFAPDGTLIYTYVMPANNYGVWVDRQGCAFTTFDDGSFYKINAAGTSHVSNPFAGKRGPLAWDTSDNVYIFNDVDRKLYRLSPDYSTSTFIAGSGTDALVDGIGAGASFSWTSHMVLDANRNIYMTNKNCIRVVTPGGVVSTIAGSPTGATGFVNGIDINARFNGLFNANLEGFVMDTAGNLYVTDHTNKAIRKIGPGVMNQVGTLIGPLANNGTYAFNGTIASVYMPDGSMYLGDGGNSRIMKISPSGVVSTFRSGRPIAGLAVDNYHNLYLSYWGTPIYKYTPAGLETQFSSAVNGYGLEVDASNNIYFAELGSNRIRRYTPDGTVSTFAGSGASATVNGTGTGASFTAPIYIARGPSGNFYVSEITNGGAIRKITPAGVVTTLATIASSTEAPIGIAVDSSENVFVSTRAASSTYGLIRMITQDGTVSLIAGGGAGTNTDGVGTAASFIGNIYDIDIDQHNNIIVADQSNFKFRMIARNAPPSGSVSITGTLTQGQTISANTSALVDVNGIGTLSYAWYSSTTANGTYNLISGATSATLTLAEAQVAKYIKVIVSYTDGRGSAEAVSATSVATVVNVNDNAVGLDISGSVAYGSTLSAITANIVDPDGNAPPYTYVWASSSSPSSGFTPITGATGSTYALALSDVGKYIRLTVGYTNNYGAADSAVATTASAVINPNNPVQGTLGISGELIEGRALLADTSAMSDPDGFGPFNYTWSSSANGVLYTVDASGLDVSGITLTAGHAGRFIKLEIRYTDAKGSAEYIVSSVVGPVIAATVPNAPSSVFATPAVLSANLSWSAPDFDGYMPVIGYRVFDASGTQLVDTSGTSYTATGLISQRTSTFTIVAYNTKGASSAAPVSVVALAPPVAAIESGEIPEAVQIPATIAGTQAIVEKVTPVVEADGTKSVVFAPEPEKAAVAIANLPAEVEKVVVATAAPQNGYTTLKISAFDSAGSNVSNFAAAPLTITLTIPGYTAETLIVRTFQEIGGPATESLIATRNQDGSYTMTLSHLTYIRVSQNIDCFVAGTKILTAAGYKAVEDIKDGELIATADGRALPCKMYITEINETTKENAPYFIPANTFAPRCPATDLTLSPLHAIQLRRGVWQVPKIAATMYVGVRQLPVGSACTYYHLEMPNYLTDNIVAEGTVVEPYGARQLAGRRVAYKFDDVVGGFVRTITEARARGVNVKRA